MESVFENGNNKLKDQLRKERQDKKCGKGNKLVQVEPAHPGASYWSRLKNSYPHYTRRDTPSETLKEN